jgi:hypothetical protein
MRTLVKLFGIAAVALAGPAVQATEFGPLMEVVHATWPEKANIGVVANYNDSREEILALAREAGAGSTIHVLDVTGRGQLEKAGNLMMQKVRPDYLVLLPSDPMVWDGSPYATRLVNQIATRGIPTVATTAKAVNQGAVFALGEGTGLELLVTRKLIGTVGVILPQKGNYVNKTASLDRGMATITLVGSF